MKITSRIALIAFFTTLLLAPSEWSDGQATVYRFRQSGSWDQVSSLVDGTFEGPGWYIQNPDAEAPGVPTTATDIQARINFGNNIVTLDYEAPEFFRLMLGVDESGTLEVKDGGVLTTTQDVIVGNNGFVEGNLIVETGAVVNVGNILRVGQGSSSNEPLDTFGYLEIQAGAVVNVGNHLWWGQRGEAIVEISGTLNQAEGNGDPILGLGTSDFNPTSSVGKATVNIRDGGVMNLNRVRGGDTQSIQPGSVIDISGTGMLTLPGDYRDILANYIAEGLILGDGQTGNVTTELVVIGLAQGDFNGDGIVDLADYTVWRDNLGGDSAALNGNGAGNPTVTSADYDLWKMNLGATSSSQTVATAGAPIAASISAVPEPSSFVLLSGVAGVLAILRRRKSPLNAGSDD